MGILYRLHDQQILCMHAVYITAKDYFNPCVVVSYLQLTLFFGTETTVGGLKQPKIVYSVAVLCYR